MSVENAPHAATNAARPRPIAGGEPLLHKHSEIARHRRAEEICLSLHQCAADGEEAVAVRASTFFTWSASRR
jgi:hypothetical protein